MTDIDMAIIALLLTVVVAVAGIACIFHMDDKQ